MLKFGDMMFELSQDRPLYQLPHETHIRFRARELAHLFRKHEMKKDYEKKYENNKVSLHICNSGTAFDRDIPCVKTCLYFDPKHTLENVVDSIQNEEIRMQWDNFIEEVNVLEQSDTGRMQVVQTKYKTISNLEGREFIEKKLYFCHSEAT